MDKDKDKKHHELRHQIPYQGTLVIIKQGGLLIQPSGPFVSSCRLAGEEYLYMGNFLGKVAFFRTQPSGLRGHGELSKRSPITQSPDV